MTTPDHDHGTPHRYPYTSERDCSTDCPYRLYIEKLDRDSTSMNTMAYLIAEALGMRQSWKGLDIDPADLARRLVAERDAMRPVVDAARVAAATPWDPFSLTGPFVRLLDAVSRLDDSARAPLSHAETRLTPGEYPGEGTADSNGLRTATAADVAEVGERRAKKRIKKVRRKLRKARAKSRQRRDMLASAEAALRDYQQVYAGTRSLIVAAKSWRGSPLDAQRQELLISAVDAFAQAAAVQLPAPTDGVAG